MPAATCLRARLVYPAATLSGILTVLAYPRYGADLLVWIALVPLFWAAAGAGPRKGFMAGWFAGLAIESGGFLWVLFAIREFSGLGRAGSFLFLPWLLFETLPWAILGVVVGLCPSGRGSGSAPPGADPKGRRKGERSAAAVTTFGRAGGAGLTRDHSPAWIFSTIPIWVAIEHFYPRLFPWQLGIAVQDRSWLVQAADILGCGGLTALILLVNGVAYLGLLWIGRRGRFPLASLAIAVVLIGAAVLYGRTRLDQIDGALAAGPALQVGVVQPATIPGEKSPGRTSYFLGLKEQTAKLLARGPLDLVAWPEGADTVGWAPERPEISPRMPTGFEDVKTPLVAGTWSWDPEADLGRNTAEYFVPGNWPPRFYHKRNLLLFGEYIPLWDSIPEGIRSRLRNVGVLSPGKDSPAFNLSAKGGPHRFRVLICYEAVLPDYVREVSDGSDFLVNVTEDVWYGNTSHIGQHLSVLRLRAVEERISILRAANIGPSGVIEPTGAMAGATTPYETTERAFTLHPVTFYSFYRSMGFAFPWACMALGAVLFTFMVWRRRDR